MKNNYSKKNNCLLCNKLITNNATYCKHCVAKKRYLNRLSPLSTIKYNKEAPNYKDGRTLITYFCKDCNKKITNTSAIYGKGRCINCSMKKIHNSKEWKRKISLQMKEKLKNPKNHPNYKNGSSFEPYSIEFTEYLKEKIRNRDNYICQICGNSGKDVHHIDYNKQNCNDTNLIILCHSCHIKTNYNRDYWMLYFK